MPERLRRKDDPSHIFSSWVYGDPATPILETYPGEPVRIRLLDGAHEEQHAWNLTGLPWRREITDPVSPLVQAQTLGISESFSLHIDEPYQAGDYLYYFGGIDGRVVGPVGHPPGLCTAPEKPAAAVRSEAPGSVSGAASRCGDSQI
ncbi:MAG: hypothetical protein ACLSHU_07360 [Oscillospiraceae bacterium]